MSTQDTRSFHTKYRPLSLKRIIGHEAHVTRLQGMINTNKLPSALLFIGPSSAGKTTLARAFASDVMGVERVDLHPDYKELNAGTTRGIDDMRDLEKIAKYKPQGKRRFIVIDEAQQLLANKAAAQAILKPLEEPVPGTTWILCSMDPTKFTQGDGTAFSNRCKQFVLQPHSEGDMLKQAKRIAKGEKMKFVIDDEDKVLLEIVRASNGEMRTLANQMESVYDYYHGMEEKPKRLKVKEVLSVLESTKSADDALVIQVLLGVYGGKYKAIQRALMDVTEGFQFINKLLWANSFMLNNFVLDGKRHRKVWWSPTNKELSKQAGEVSLGVLAGTNAALVETKAQASMFQTTPEELLSARLYRLIKELHTSK